MEGRHRAPAPPPARRGQLIVAVVAVALLGGTGAAVVAMNGNEPRPATLTAAATVHEPARDGEAAPVAAPAQDAPSTSPLPLPQVQACLTEIASGEAAVQAAQTSAEHWQAHVQAQIDLDTGANTREETVAAWAASKATGPADVAAFTAAHQEHQQHAGACDRLAQAAPTAENVSSCVERAEAFAAAVAAGQAVNQDWAAHLEMMAHKDHIEGYNAKWRQMVAAAPTNLDGFASARDALGSVTECNLSS